MLRRLFAFASSLSLLLAVGVAVLWVRSYWAMDSVQVGWHRFGYFSYDSTVGEMCMGADRIRAPGWGRDFIDEIEVKHDRVRAPKNQTRTLSFTHERVFGWWQSTDVYIADWLALLLLLILPATWVWRRRRARPVGHRGFIVLTPESPRPAQC